MGLFVFILFLIKYYFFIHGVRKNKKLDNKNINNLNEQTKEDSLCYFLFLSGLFIFGIYLFFIRLVLNWEFRGFIPVFAFYFLLSILFDYFIIYRHNRNDELRAIRPNKIRNFISTKPFYRSYVKLKSLFFITNLAGSLILSFFTLTLVNFYPLDKLFYPYEKVDGRNYSKRKPDDEKVFLDNGLVKLKKTDAFLECLFAPSIKGFQEEDLLNKIIIKYFEKKSESESIRWIGIYEKKYFFFKHYILSSQSEFRDGSIYKKMSEKNTQSICIKERLPGLPSCPCQLKLTKDSLNHIKLLALKREYGSGSYSGEPNPADNWYIDSLVECELDVEIFKIE